MNGHADVDFASADEVDHDTKFIERTEDPSKEAVSSCSTLQQYCPLNVFTESSAMLS